MIFVKLHLPVTAIVNISTVVNWLKCLVKDVCPFVKSYFQVDLLLCLWEQLKVVKPAKNKLDMGKIGMH